MSHPKNKFLWIIRVTLKCIVVVVVIYGVISAYRRWLKSDSTFVIKSIEIQGNEILSDEKVLLLAKLNDDAKIWKADLISAEAGIESSPFVDNAVVKRCLPNILQIKIEEKKPVALLHFNETFYCIDREGWVLPSKPRKLYDFPILSGQFEGDVIVGKRVGGALIEQGLCFLAKVIEDRPELYNDISEIVLGQPQGLILYTSQSGVPIWLGNDRISYKIRYLEAILQDLSKTQKLSQLGYIDLRFQGQVIVGMGA